MPSVFEIAKWLDDKTCPLVACARNPLHYGYHNREEFLSALATKAIEIENSGDSGWNEINIARCLHGLRGMDATTPAVQQLLSALTAKIQAATALLDAQAIGNALYGLQCMDATTPVVQQLLSALTAKIQAATA